MRRCRACSGRRVWGRGWSARGEAVRSIQGVGDEVGLERVNDADADDVGACAGVENRVVDFRAVAYSGEDEDALSVGEVLDAAGPPVIEDGADAHGEDVGLEVFPAEHIEADESPELVDIDACFGGGAS